LPLVFQNRTSQASWPIFNNASNGVQNVQGFDNTMEESSIMHQVPTLNSSTYANFAQHANAFNRNETAP
jgi:hypothetical protein